MLSVLREWWRGDQKIPPIVKVTKAPIGDLSLLPEEILQRLFVEGYLTIKDMIHFRTLCCKSLRQSEKLEKAFFLIVKLRAVRVDQIGHLALVVKECSLSKPSFVPPGCRVALLASHVFFPESREFPKGKLAKATPSIMMAILQMRKGWGDDQVYITNQIETKYEMPQEKNIRQVYMPRRAFGRNLTYPEQKEIIFKLTKDETCWAYKGQILTLSENVFDFVFCSCSENSQWYENNDQTRLAIRSKEKNSQFSFVVWGDRDLGDSSPLNARVNCLCNNVAYSRVGIGLAVEIFFR